MKHTRREIDAGTPADAKRDTSKWSRMSRDLQCCIGSFLGTHHRTAWSLTCWAFADAARRRESWFDRFDVGVNDWHHTITLCTDDKKATCARTLTRLQALNGIGIRVRHLSFQSCLCRIGSAEVWQALLGAVRLDGLQTLWLDRRRLAPSTEHDAIDQTEDPPSAVLQAMRSFQPLNLGVCANHLVHATFQNCLVPDDHVVGQLRQLRSLTLQLDSATAACQSKMLHSLHCALRGAKQLPHLQTLAVHIHKRESYETSAKLVGEILQCRTLTHLSVCVTHWPYQGRDFTHLPHLKHLSLTVFMQTPTTPIASWYFPLGLETIRYLPMCTSSTFNDQEWQEEQITNMLRSAQYTLTELYVRHGLNNPTLLRVLGGLTHLRRLTLQDTVSTTLTSLAPLQQLTQLEFLALQDAQLSDVSWRTLFGAGFPRLHTLQMCRCNWSLANLLPAALSLPALTVLDMQANEEAAEEAKEEEKKKKKKKKEYEAILPRPDPSHRQTERALAVLESRERLSELRRWFPRLQQLEWSIPPTHRSVAHPTGEETVGTSVARSAGEEGEGEGEGEEEEDQTVGQFLA